MLDYELEHASRPELFGEDVPPSVRLSNSYINSFLKKLEASGCTRGTLQIYKRHLEKFYEFLPESKRVSSGTGAEWREHLQGLGYSVKTVNVYLSAFNGLMAHIGRKDLQADRLAEEDNIGPELTRKEYLRLLSTARKLGRERVYLLVKLFATTGLPVSELEYVTAEAVERGRADAPSGAARIPDGLRKELLSFAARKRVSAGPIFLSKDGTPQGRTVITNMIKSLCVDAQVAEEKVNPRCLRKLYIKTQEGIMDKLAVLAEHTYDRMLEREQNAIGWDRR